MSREAALPYSSETDPMRHGIMPLAIWDADDGSFYDQPTETWKESHNWAINNLPNAQDTYRAEFYKVDTVFAILYEFAVIRTGEWRGVRVVFPPTGKVSRRKPYIYLLDELPPAHLLTIPKPKYGKAGLMTKHDQFIPRGMLPL